MPKLALSTKRALIDRANTNVVVLTSVAAFVLVFCGVATKTLISQAAYQNRVISQKRAALNLIKSDIGNVTKLKTSYSDFSGKPVNVLGGSSTGTGAQDGNNAKLVLDALPSGYDFPALATSLDKLLGSQQVTITSITGTDDELAQKANNSSAVPTPVEMPFQVAVTGSYDNIQTLVSTFEKSIRPIKIQTMDIAGNQSALSLTVTAETFYQPAKSLSITTKVVK